MRTPSLTVRITSTVVLSLLELPTLYRFPASWDGLGYCNHCYYITRLVIQVCVWGVFTPCCVLTPVAASLGPGVAEGYPLADPKLSFLASRFDMTWGRNRLYTDKVLARPYLFLVKGFSQLWVPKEPRQGDRVGGSRVLIPVMLLRIRIVNSSRFYTQTLCLPLDPNKMRSLDSADTLCLTPQPKAKNTSTHIHTKGRRLVNQGSGLLPHGCGDDTVSCLDSGCNMQCC